MNAAVTLLRCCECGLSLQNTSTSLDGLPCHYHCALTATAQQSGILRSKRSPAITVILSAEQQNAHQAIQQAIKEGRHFAVHGLAGAGKTTLAAHVAASLPGDAFLCAPTAKAAHVLTQKTGITASSIHAAFYRFVKR